MRPGFIRRAAHVQTAMLWLASAALGAVPDTTPAGRLVDAAQVDVQDHSDLILQRTQQGQNAVDDPVTQHALDTCLHHLDSQAFADAEACYAAIETSTVDKQVAATAAELRLLARDMKNHVARPAPHAARVGARPGLLSLIKPRLMNPDYVDSGKLELVMTSAPYAALTGLGIGRLHSPQAAAISSLAGAAVGLGGSLLATLAPTDLDQRHTALIRSGMIMGFANAVLVGAAVDQRLPLSSRADLFFVATSPQAGVAAAVTSIGMVGVSVASSLFFHPSTEAVTLAHSAALWSAAFSTLGLETARNPLAARPSFIAIAVATDLAYAAMLAAAPLVKLQREEVWLIDLGGLLGGIAAWGGASLIQDRDPSLIPASVMGGALLGGLTGFALGRLVDHELSRNESPVAGLKIDLLPSIITTAAAPGKTPAQPAQGAALRIAW